MPSTPTSQDTSTARALRQRDNKRRHRARQKEYTASLERRLAEAREQGVQATKEVQVAAQKIKRENARLRELLCRSGYSDDAIDAWVSGDGELCARQPWGMGRGEAVERARRGAEEGGARKAKEKGLREERSHVSVNTSRCIERSTKCTSPTTGPGTTPSPSSSLNEPTKVPPAPCKLVTLLSQNPAADLTQAHLPSKASQKPTDASTVDDGHGSVDGVECSSAYQMLMQYATSEEKMDRIATVLESGCTPCATGGCKVKKDVIWQALSEECT